MNKTIEITLRALGVNNSYKGFHFLIYGLRLAMTDPAILTYVCKGLYIEIAIRYHTTTTCVERNIRTVKEIIWTRGNSRLLTKIFGDLYGDSLPSNSVFIDMLAYYIKNNLLEEEQCVRYPGTRL